MLVSPSSAPEVAAVSPAATSSVVDRVAVRSIEAVSAFCLLACLGVIVLAVVFRYVFNNSLVWSEEVARLLLVAITFIGGALAQQRRQHINLPYLEMLAPRVAAHLNIAFAIAVAAFCILICWAQVAEYMPIRMMLTLPGTGWPQGIFSVPVIVGSAALAVIALRQSMAFGWLEWSGAALTMIASAAAVYFLSGWAIDQFGLNPLVIAWLAFFALLALGMPTAFVMGISGLIYIVLSPDPSLFALPQHLESGINSFVLLAVPLFIFTGFLLEATSVSDRLIDLMRIVVGRVRGGMGLVTIGGMYLFSGISGSPTADVSAVGSVMTPTLRRQGFSGGESVGLISASAVMGHTVPPSIAVIVLAQVSDLSVGTLFVAGVLPAAVLGVVLAAFVLYRSYQLGLDRNPALTNAERWTIFLRGLPALSIPLILFGGLFSGIVTPTEVAALAVIVSLIISGIALRDLTWAQFIKATVDSAAITGMALMLLATANLLVHASVDQGIPQAVGHWMTYVVGDKYLFLALSFVILIVAGALLEFPALLIMGPLLVPAAVALGFDPIHYAIFLLDAMVIGHFMPTLGILFFVTCGVTGVRVNEAVAPTFVYLGIVTIGLVLIALFPWITLSVPQALGMIR